MSPLKRRYLKLLHPRSPPPSLYPRPLPVGGYPRHYNKRNSSCPLKSHPLQNHPPVAPSLTKSPSCLLVLDRREMTDHPPHPWGPCIKDTTQYRCISHRISTRSIVPWLYIKLIVESMWLCMGVIFERCVCYFAAVPRQSSLEKGDLVLWSGQVSLLNICVMCI